MYRNKSYGRNAEVAAVYQMFNAGRNISMHGPRRLGKTFLLDRIVDAAPDEQWVAVKVELAGCADTRAVFRQLCSCIGNARTGGARARSWITQRLSQFVAPRNDSSGPWYQAFLSTDHETFFERMIEAMHEDKDARWVLLIDELPIFLKALHDKGADGIATARNFMNFVVRLQQQYHKVRWMITGSIGIEPLAQSGNYMGVLAKFSTFELCPLEPMQAADYLKDIAQLGQLPGRKVITDQEANLLADAVGWRAAFYLDALAQKLTGPPTTDYAAASAAVEDALKRLVTINEMAVFGTWEEHLRKHYNDTDRNIAFAVLNLLSKEPSGADLDAMLTGVGITTLTRDGLRKVLIRLCTEGFITTDNWAADAPRCTFLNPLLRRWWNLAKPHPTL